MIELYVLPADEGDFLWLSYGEEKCHHILIDGGLENCGEDYAEIIESIAEKDEKVEALILTHIDSDHIQGAIKGISLVAKETLKNTIKHIYFNTCRGYLREKKAEQIKEKYAEDEIKVSLKKKGYSVGEAIDFLELLKRKDLINILDDYVVSGRKIELSDGAIIKIISPEEKELEALCLKWEEYEQKKKNEGYASNLENVKLDINDLKKEKLTEDNSVNNASSIAFIFEYKENKIAFLGDALAKVCLDGLKKFNEKEKMDMVKISHHGSRGNTSDKLLNCLDTNHYIISTDGSTRKVPSKVLIAHLLKKEKTTILCNYAWWDSAYFGKYFTEQDKKEYLDTEKIVLKELDDKGYLIKDGLIVYGEYR